MTTTTTKRDKFQLNETGAIVELLRESFNKPDFKDFEVEKREDYTARNAITAQPTYVYNVTVKFENDTN